MIKNSEVAQPRHARRRKSLRAPGCQLKSSTATSYERGEKQNANFKSNNDRGRFGGRLKLGRVCSKKGDDSHGNNGRPDVFQVNSLSLVDLRKFLTQGQGRANAGND